MIRPLGLVACLCVLTGCVMEPITGRRRLILTPMSMETELGLQAWSETLKKERLSTNASRTAAVTRVGDALKKTVKASGYDWEFKLFESKQANAFCLPGGKIAVYEGLFDFLRNDAELAAVVGHEIAHATARHGGERMTQALAVNLGTAALLYATSGQGAEQQQRWLLAYTGISNLGVILPYSRVHEYAADRIGLIYMARAGYDPRAAVNFWTSFAAGKGKQSAISEFLSTHPLGEKRIAKLKEHMGQALAEYRKAPKRHGYGQTY
ncbi:MAG: M48 family metallopeptidase [Lentisphaeria bacterium]|nr:M48 family metallopeptidase [Lentisphaeria bacterium]